MLTIIATSAALLAGMLDSPPAAMASSVRPALQPARAPGSDIYDFSSRVVLEHNTGVRDKIGVKIGTREISSADAKVDPEFDRHCNTGVWVLVLSRTGLTVQQSFIVPICDNDDSKVFYDRLKLITADRLIVVNSIEDLSSTHLPVQPLSLGGAMEYLGAAAADFGTLDLTRTSFSVVGVPGGGAGGAQYALTDQVPRPGEPTRAAVTGRLVPDISNSGQRRYSLAHLDFVTYEVSQHGNIIINGEERKAPPRPAGFTGGYRVLVLHRRDPSTEPVSDEFYDTHSSLLAQIKMERDLTKLADSGTHSVIVFIVTIGNPVNATPLPRTITLQTGCELGAEAFTETCTYNSTKHEQSFTVPNNKIDGVDPDIDVTLQGARGGSSQLGRTGGLGARFSAAIKIGGKEGFPIGKKIYVDVGGNGEPAGNGYCSQTPAQGGWNGGANGGSNCIAAGYPGGGGGGATDLRTESGSGIDSLNSRFFIAAGGGGAGGRASKFDEIAGGDGGSAAAAGAAGGRSTLGKAAAPGGGAAGSSSGGTASQPAKTGDLGKGGAGAEPNSDGVDHAGGGGGGGGGKYGGGGGGAINSISRAGTYGGGGGGGGSSLTPGNVTAQPVSAPAVASFHFLTTFGPTLGDVLSRFGATPTLVQQISSKDPRYALVGTPGGNGNASEDPFTSAEASPFLVGPTTPTGERPTGELQGVLTRGDKDMRYDSLQSHAVSPVLDNGAPDGNDAVQNGLFDVLADRRTGACLQGSACPAPGADFPFQIAGTADNKALLTLEAQLCPAPQNPNDPSTCQQHPTNIRTTYASADTASEQTAVQGLSAPAAPVGFTVADYNRVRSQILLELGDATRVHAQEDSIDTVLSSLPTIIPAVGDEVIRELANVVPSDTEHEGSNSEDVKATKIVAFVVELLEAFFAVIGIHPVAALLALVAASLTFGLEAEEFDAVDKRSEPKDEPAWEGKAHALVSSIEEQFTAMTQRNAEMFDLIYGTWGMLGTYATNLKADPADWDATSKVQQRTFEASSRSAALLGMYRELTPLRFDAAETTTANGDASPRFCFTSHSGGHEDCETSGEGAYRYETNIVDPKTGASTPHFRYVVVAAQPKEKATALPASLLDRLAALGLFTPDLYLRWPFARAARVRPASEAQRATACVTGPAVRRTSC